MGESLGSWSASGARPARAPSEAAGGELAVLRGVGSHQQAGNAGLRLLWGWAKPRCVGVTRVALVGVLVGSAASQRRIAIVMYGLSCGMLPATTHPSHTPLSLALFVSSGRSLETRAHPLFGR